MATKKKKQQQSIPPLLINLVLAAFVLGWVSSIVAEIFRNDYSAPTGLNEGMIAIVTAFFVAQQRLAKDDDDEDDDPPPPRKRRTTDETTHSGTEGDGS